MKCEIKNFYFTLSPLNFKNISNFCDKREQLEKTVSYMFYASSSMS